ncbi:hypothetical protein ACIRRH_41260 [Kitasatospora sp. NPDC101235]|uniref:hypothetical protein n=1 Tax=Kitasatospora sp. NPDC101235 TaxID=3364101 RepID=UPI00382C247D
MSAYPHRLRLHGGRNSHSAKQFAANQPDLVTACGYLASPRDKRLPDDAPITCRAPECAAVAKETTR